MKKPFEERDEEQNQEASEKRIFTYAKKVKTYFSTEPQKEKVLRHEDFSAAGDVYYAHVSASYKIAQRTLLVILVVFILFSVFINRHEITYDNFFYLMKDFSSAAGNEQNHYETLSYESDSRQKFALYRGGLVTVSPSRISAFTATGRRTLNDTSSFSSPYVVTSGKYMLVYDTSGKTFSIYNSFARVYSENLNYPVTDACFAEDGSFVIVTRSADSRSVVMVYNKSFKKLSELRADYFVFDVQMSKARNTLALLSYDMGDGTGRTTLSVRDLSTLEESNRIRLDGEFPLACGFLERNTFALLTDRNLRILNGSWEDTERANEEFEGNIVGYSLDSNGVAVSVTISSQNRVIAFDKNGNLLYNDFVPFNVSDIAVLGEHLYLQTEQGVTRFRCADESYETLRAGQGKMLIYNEGTVMVCGESKAQYLIFRD